LLVLFTGTAVICVALAVQFLSTARPFIGGVDFFYYVLFARDLAGDATDVPVNRYIYFPGVYSFWRTVFLFSDGSLESLQWAYVGVLLANALFTGLILSLLTGIWQAGLLAAAVYVFAAARIEGLSGCTEPIATIPFVLGMWLFLLLRGSRRPTLSLLALGTGFGLALFAKQQGGLLFFGSLGLLPFIFATSEPGRYRMSHLLLLPLSTGGVFLFAMLLEGGGVPALVEAIHYVTSYQPQGSWFEHVDRARALTRPVSTLFLSACALWVPLALLHRKRPLASDAVLLALGLSIWSALGGLLQFSRRGYLHYALLILPSVITAAGLAVFLVATWIQQSVHLRSRLVAPIAIAGITLFLWVTSAGAADFVRYAAEQIASPTQRVRADETRKAFAPLCERVRPGSDLLLIPSRDNIVHWLCRTRSLSYRAGYGWWPDDLGLYLDALPSPSLEYVFVFSDDRGPFEQQFFTQNDRAFLIRELHRHGYQESLAFREGRLFANVRGPRASSVDHGAPVDPPAAPTTLVSAWKRVPIQDRPQNGASPPGATSARPRLARPMRTHRFS
jgi:hypothetical protein